MKTISSKLILTLFVIYAAIAAPSTLFAQSAFKAAGNQGAALTDKGWPRKFVAGANPFSVYQPQVEQWQDNRFEARAAVGARGASYNPQTGVISAGATGATYNAATGQVTATGRGFAYNTKTETGVAVGKNNVYAGKDGEVYRYNKSDGLQQRTDSGWSSVGRPADNKYFQNQQSARATGQQRWDNFRSGGNTFGGSGSRGFDRGGFGSGLRGSRPRFGGRR